MIPLSFKVVPDGGTLRDLETLLLHGRTHPIHTVGYLSCDITLRMYDPETGKVGVCDFQKGGRDGRPLLYRIEWSLPTEDDRRFLEALERGEAKHVDIDGFAEGSPLRLRIL